MTTGAGSVGRRNSSHLARVTASPMMEHAMRGTKVPHLTIASSSQETIRESSVEYHRVPVTACAAVRS